MNRRWCFTRGVQHTFLKCALAGLLLALAGCASTQLNHNALDLTASLDSLTTRQIIYNLARTLEDPYSVPSQASIAAGSATTANNLQPQLSLPLNSTNLLTDALPGANGTYSNSSTRPSSVLGLAFSDSWQQGWTLDPATDPDQLRRLRALYRYATGQIGKENHEIEFECEYPIQTAAPDSPLSPVPTAFQLSCRTDEGRSTDIQINPDPNFIRWPSCVICEDRSNSPFLNKMLTYNFVRPHPFAGSRLLGRYGRIELYICADATVCGVEGMRAFHELRLFVFEASGQSNRATGSSKSPSIRALGPPLLTGTGR
jgi:hypothetical protein